VVAGGYEAAMVRSAFKPIGHLTAWIVWHAARVSLLEDVKRPQPPSRV
jgi:hypothetical protein